MPAPYGDKFWAEWCRDFCEVAKIWPQKPNIAYAELLGEGWDRQRVATMVSRMRRKGYLTPIDEGFFLTPLAQEQLHNLDAPAESVVAFNIRVLARNKAQALAQLWSLEQQLESWDPSTGQPFRPREEKGEE